MSDEQWRDGVEIPEKETLSLSKREITEAIEEGKETVFSVPEQRLRYTISVERIEGSCDRRDCDGVPVVDGKFDNTFCGIRCLDEFHEEYDGDRGAKEFECDNCGAATYEQGPCVECGLEPYEGPDDGE